MVMVPPPGLDPIDIVIGDADPNADTTRCVDESSRTSTRTGPPDDAGASVIALETCVSPTWGEVTELDRKFSLQVPVTLVVTTPGSRLPGVWTKSLPGFPLKSLACFATIVDAYVPWRQVASALNVTVAVPAGCRLRFLTWTTLPLMLAVPGDAVADPAFTTSAEFTVTLADAGANCTSCSSSRMISWAVERAPITAPCVGWRKTRLTVSLPSNSRSSWMVISNVAVDAPGWNMTVPPAPV